MVERSRIARICKLSVIITTALALFIVGLAGVMLQSGRQAYAFYLPPPPLPNPCLGKPPSITITNPTNNEVFPGGSISMTATTACTYAYAPYIINWIVNGQPAGTGSSAPYWFRDLCSAYSITANLISSGKVIASTIVTMKTASGMYAGTMYYNLCVVDGHNANMYWADLPNESVYIVNLWARSDGNVMQGGFISSSSCTTGTTSPQSTVTITGGKISAYSGPILLTGIVTSFDSMGRTDLSTCTIIPVGTTITITGSCYSQEIIYQDSLGHDNAVIDYSPGAPLTCTQQAGVGYGPPNPL